MAIKYLKSSNIKNKTVFLRVDVNEPMGKNGEPSDDFRLRAIVPTLNFLIEKGCKIIIGAHLGRPEGKKVKALSLKPIANELAEILGLKFVETKSEVPKSPIPQLVFHEGDLLKESVRESIISAPQKEVIFLENLRYYQEEEGIDPFFSKKLASLAEVYVDDAFAVSHHPAASTVGITKFLPSYAGLVMEKEVKSLDSVIHGTKKPFVVLVGGIKVSDKEPSIKNLIKHTDYIMVSGGVANAFFLSKGYEIGISEVEKESVKLAWHLEKNYKSKIILPLDLVVADKEMSKNSIRVCAPHEVLKSDLILDIGPKTIFEFAKHIKKAKTFLWSGPLGKFEVRPFHHGTLAIARITGAVGKGRCFVVVGGGETVDAIRLAKQEEYIDHLSTGGGAMLKYLAGDKLPGIEALKI